MTVTAAMVGTLAFAAATPVFAQDSDDRAAAQRVLQHQPAISIEETGAINRVTLLEGKNSFTESQARERIEGAGFTHIGALVLDQHGIWRGTASKGAMTVDVGLDFKGNIAADNARAQ
jgi:putative membrane protein